MVETLKTIMIKLKIVIVLFVVIGVSMPARAVKAANTDIGSAKSISFGTQYNDSITSSVDRRYYKITLPTSGKIWWNVEADIQYFRMYIYDSNSEELFYDYDSRSSVTNRATINNSLDLTSGIYYVEISEKYGSNTGDFNFIISYTPSNETFSESGDGSNNNILVANEISFNNVYISQLAKNDSVDCFKFNVVTSGTISFWGEGDIGAAYFKIYDNEGTGLYSDYESRDSVTNRSTLNRNYYLQKGAYYLRIGDVYSSQTGVIQFRLLFASANESFQETGADDTIQRANSINYNTKYYGQLAKNHDDVDYYKFTVSGKKIITLDFTSEMTSGYARIYDQSGNSQGYLSFNNTANITKSDIWQLSSGTYYLCVSSNSYCGNYSFKIGTITVPKKVTLSSVKSNKKRKVTAKWKKISGVSGYELQYSSTKYFYYTNTYIVKGKSKTIKGLYSKNRYYFRVRAYKIVGNNKIYGAWSKKKSVKVR